MATSATTRVGVRFASIAARAVRSLLSPSGLLALLIVSLARPPTLHALTARPSASPSSAALQVRYHKHGHPSAVLQVESVTLDTASVGARDVLVRMVCAPLTALDVAAVTGFGGRAPAFPRVGGNEGLGIVEQAGASSGLAKGDVVVASSPGVGALQAGARRRNVPLHPLARSCALGSLTPTPLLLALAAPSFPRPQARGART